MRHYVTCSNTLLPVPAVPARLVASPPAVGLYPNLEEFDGLRSTPPNIVIRSPRYQAIIVVESVANSI